MKRAPLGLPDGRISSDYIKLIRRRLTTGRVLAGRLDVTDIQYLRNQPLQIYIARDE